MPDRVIAAGRYALTAAMDDALRAACGAPARGADNQAHPGFAFVAALGGMDRDIGALCISLGLPFDTGAMLGRCHIRFDRPLLVDCVLEVEARLRSLVRKSSRRFGAADHLGLAMSLSCDGVRQALVEVTIIVPVARSDARTEGACG